MAFSELTSTAPASAQFTQYRSLGGSVVFVGRLEDGTWECIASTTRSGARLLAAGISASGLSLWDADAGHFVRGTAAQLTTEK